jgi:predicted dienelactone hydrolase
MLRSTLFNQTISNMHKLLLISAISAFIFCTSSSVFGAEELYTEQLSVTPSLALPGKYTAGVTTLETVNPNQLDSKDFISRSDRKLTLEVWYPAQTTDSNARASYVDQTRSGKSFELAGRAMRNAKPKGDRADYPLIVLSHGYTGYRSIMFYLGEHLASHGYVVAAIDHTDSRNSDIDFATNAGAGFISTLYNRARDQQFVLDYFAESKAEVAKLANTNQAAVIGYSMGGYGALNTVGGCYAYTAEGLQLFGVPKQYVDALVTLFNSCSAGREAVDPRWQAMIAFAPWGGETGVHDLASLGNIKIPKLFITGDADDISGYENGVKALWEHSGTAANHLLIYQNARHNFATHPAPRVAYTNDLDIGHYYEPSWSKETLNRINMHMNLAFLDCYLKKQESACQMLPKRPNITQIKQADGKLSDPWPGFPDRWGTGVEFHSTK